MSETKKPSIAVPVRVTTEHVARPIQPPVELPTPSAHQAKVMTVKRAQSKSPDSFHQTKKLLPEAQRRKIMWTTVTAAMVIIVTGWGFLWRYEFSSTGQNTLFADIKNVWQKFSASNQPPPATTNQEVRDLTKEIFPQFDSVQ